MRNLSPCKSPSLPASHVAPASPAASLWGAPQPGNADRSPEKSRGLIGTQHAIVSPFQVLPASSLCVDEAPASPSHVPASPEAADSVNPNSYRILAIQQSSQSAMPSPSGSVEPLLHQPPAPSQQHQQSSTLTLSHTMQRKSQLASPMLTCPRPAVFSASQMLHCSRPRTTVLPPSPLRKSTGPVPREAYDEGVMQQAKGSLKPGSAPELLAEDAAPAGATSDAALGSLVAQTQTQADAPLEDVTLTLAKEKQKSKQHKMHSRGDKLKGMLKPTMKSKSGENLKIARNEHRCGVSFLSTLLMNLMPKRVVVNAMLKTMCVTPNIELVGNLC